MAISQNNVVTYGLSGKVGDLLVFRKQNGKTIVSKVPVKSNKPPTALQIEVKDRFKLASKFAKQAMQEPTLEAYYRATAKKGQRPFNAAFSDFFIAPEVSNPNGDYDGLIGTILSVMAVDNYEVKTVTLIITKGDDSLVEQGPATLMVDGINWSYACQSSNAVPSGCKLLWTASDWAGNQTLLEVLVP